MAERLPPLNALRAFEVAARHLSFRRAAEELSVTPTAISHQIRSLEEHLGVSLFRRLTRALELTPEGEAMLPKLREGMDCFSAAVAAVRAFAPDPRLVVLAPPSLALRWLLPRLQRFTSMYPEVELHLSGSAAMIDRGDAATQRLPDVEAALSTAPEIWIRNGYGRYPGCRVDLVLEPDYTAVCSPQLLRGKLPLRKPTDMRYQTLIHDDTIQDLQERPNWAEWLKVAGVKGVDTTAGPHFTDSGLAIAAALGGFGVALLSRPLVAAEIAAGQLVAPFDISLGRRFAYYIVTPEEIADRPVVAAFRNWLLDESGMRSPSVSESGTGTA
ncbi:LysR family transcriptional regulator [Parazoarcus communis]|uniref:LysR family transcriptional regulator n=1 Tax=Parazoarcus communis TaxID=41977 RepID=A0A2U8H8C1_9RHOO|nr:transcriptional regulator GcvA [Parazoarcus communis]AWI81830.1 LysR family transcriptional regulator [Parazoarcus communis]